MSNTKVCIKDVRHIENLNASITYCKSSLEKIIDEVDRHLVAVVSNMKNCRENLKLKIDDMERELERMVSESDPSELYADCYGEGDFYDQMFVEPFPRERSQINLSKENLYRIDQIISEVEDEINKFQAVGSERLLRDSLDNLFVKAVWKLEDILEFANQYRNWTPTVNGFSNISVLALDSSHVLDRQRKASEGVMNSQEYRQELMFASKTVSMKQHSQAHTNDYADADEMAICPRCHRPIPICLCKSK